MPTYDGIGETITHKLEIEGDMFLQDIEGGPNSTQVPLEIFSNFHQSSVESANSRMLRLRVQNAAEADVSNSYVTDFGIRGEADKDYFFITAPQNTSNVGDQNTFVISKTSNVGIGTTDPGHYRLLVNSSSTKHFGVPGNDTPTTGDTLVYNENGDWVYHFVEGTLPPGTVNNEILTWNGVNWVPNHSIVTTNSNTAIGIGTYTPSSNLHVIGSVTATSDVDISGKFQGGKLRVGSLLSAVPTNPNVTVPGDLTVSGTLTSDEWIHTSNLDITGNINVDHDVLIDGTYQGTGMRLDGTLQNLRGAIPDLSVAGSITATGDIKTDQTFRGTDASITGTITTSNITHGSELTVTTNLLMGPGTTLTASNIVGASPVTISSGLVMGSGSTLTTSNIVGSSFLTVTANTNVVAEFTESSRYYHVKEPRVAKMTAATYNGYVASASSSISGWEPYEAFGLRDYSVNSGDSNVWASALSVVNEHKYIYNTGSYTGTVTTTATDASEYVGEWLQIQLPTPIKLQYSQLFPRPGYPSVMPKNGTILGSTNSTDWYSISSWENASYATGQYTRHNALTENYYDYYRLVVEDISASGVGALTVTEIADWELYGTPYTAATNDGTDVLLKSVPNTPKTDFLEVYYDAKEYSGSGNITDETGNGNTGTPTNVTFNSTEPKSFEFNGTSSYISATFNSNTLDVGNVHSICMWIKPNAIQSGYKSLFEFGQESPNSLTGVFLVNGRVAFLHYGNNLESGYLTEADRWYFITCIYTPGRKIYVNSQFVTSDTYSSLNISNFSAKLGANLSNGELFDGSIANFRFYDRPLSEDEIWEIYSYQKAYFSISPDVVTYKAGRVGIGTSEPRAVLDVVGDVNFSPISTWKILGKTGNFTESGDFTLNLNLSQEAQPNTCWEIRLAFGFTGTNSGTFAISGAIGSDDSTVGVSEGNSVQLRQAGVNWSDPSAITYLTANREIFAPAYLAVIKIVNVYGPNVSLPADTSISRYHFTYECVGCHKNVGATTYKGQGFFRFSNRNITLNTIKFNCDTGTVNGNYNVLAF